VGSLKLKGLDSTVSTPKVLRKCAPLLTMHNGHAYIHASLQEHTEEQHEPRGVVRESPLMGDSRRGDESIV